MVGEYRKRVVETASDQAQTVYEDYKKIKGFEDVGYFLVPYVVQGGVVTKNVTRNDTIEVTEIVVSLNDDIQVRGGTSFRTKIPSTSYYLDFKDGDFTFGTAHPPGTVGDDYLRVATVETDSYGNVNTIIDNAQPRGGFRLKTEYGLFGYMRPIANILDYGAKGDGVTDDTEAIQRALNASQNVLVPPGVYRLSATLTGRPNQSITGVTPELCQFVRNTAYGHTLKIGADVNPDNTDHAGAVQISGIWFNHQYSFNNGPTYIPAVSKSIVNKDPSSTHLRIEQGQNVRIKDCWFYGIGHGIEFIDSTVIWVERCLFNGLWDKNVSGLQDSTSGIYVRASTSDRRSGILNVTGCHIGGYGPGAPVEVTTGDVTVSKSLNAGMRYGIYITSCERFSIADNYIGGQSMHNIFLSASAIIGHGVIHGNMFDGGTEYCIKINSTDPAFWANFIDIHDNTAVGYGIEQGFIFLQALGGLLAATRVNIANNIAHYFYRAPIRIEKARGVRIANNIIAAYNTDGATNNDPFVAAGCVVFTDATYIDSMGNTWGGAITDPQGTNSCQWGIFFYETENNTTGLERNAGLGLVGGTLVGGLSQTYPT
ncbi:glycosyl hydrolase family 28-related protein [Paenibacillus sp. GYB004]|uniref:glycosyl hydrolase family 28-related protein n=1 Tax=Paenibacillus sp. GYB004 TaxID=2994393 RepID=UPI002F96D07F